MSVQRTGRLLSGWLRRRQLYLSQPDASQELLDQLRYGEAAMFCPCPGVAAQYYTLHLYYRCAKTAGTADRARYNMQCLEVSEPVRDELAEPASASL